MDTTPLLAVRPAQEPAPPRSLRWRYRGVALLAVAVATATLVSARFDALVLAGRGWAGVVLGLCLTAIVLLPVLWAAERAKWRTGEPLGRDGANSGWAPAEASLHRRVRLAFLTVLVATGSHALVQVWYDDVAARMRDFDRELADLAGAQRMLGQRIARLAALLGQAGDSASHDRQALQAALEEAARGAQRIEAMLRQQTLQSSDNAEALALAVREWQRHREALWTRGRALLAASEHAGAPELRQMARAAEAQADPALVAAQGLVQVLGVAQRQRYERMSQASRLWFWFNLLMVAGLTVFVGEPVARSIRRQHRRMTAQTRDLEQLALVAETTSNAVMITDAQARLLWVNRAFTRITGYSAEQALGRRSSDLLRTEQADPAGAAKIRAAQHQGRVVRIQVLGRTREGRDLWLDLDAQPLTSPAGELTGFVEVAADITERRRHVADLRVAAIAFDSRDAVVITDPGQVILKVNHAFTRITGYAPDEAIGRVTGQLLRSGRQDTAFYDTMWSALERHRHWQGEIWNRRKNGEVYPEWLSITAVTDDDGVVTNYVAVFADITQKKQADQTIHHLAFYDSLTSLPNRRLLVDRLQQALAGGERHGCGVAVLFLDLDNFKELNDTRGHDVGDLLLAEVGRRLAHCVRANDTVARQGGDEFVIVLDGLASHREQAAVQAELIAEKVRDAINRPFMLAGQACQRTTSIGICVSCADDLTVDEMLKRADTAMYDAKRSGRNAIRFFDPAVHAAMQARFALAMDLQHALAHDQLRLHYQRQVDQQGHILGAEVLLRWQHPQRGPVSPGQFIPVAEDTDLIVDIGQWVLEMACRRLRAWAGQPHTRDLQLAVNLSARQFRQPGFVQQVHAALQRTGADPSRLKLELTESLVIGNVEEAVAKMGAIRALGVRFAMDDFGTGQSSLSYLTRLPLDQLKIDQSFVSNIAVKPSDAIIVQTIIGMARNLGLDVIAEGVETLQQRDFLAHHGCTCYQGFLFGRPAPLEVFEAAVADDLRT